MINRLLFQFVRAMLRLRYRIRVRGLEEVASRGSSGILFLPNHPALIDPAILMAVLGKAFAPRALADKDQIDRFFIRRLARRLGVRAIPDLEKYGRGSEQAIKDALAASIQALREGENLLVYPAGQLDRERLESLAGKSAAEVLLREAPQARVVLVRTRGLWGSGFGWAGGKPNVPRLLRKGILGLLASAVFFAPKREVTIELIEPDAVGDFRQAPHGLRAAVPRGAPRAELNRYLEDFYNDAAPPESYVPYSIWGRPGRPAPAKRGAAPAGRVQGHVASEATRQVVLAHLRELSGKGAIADDDRLANELGLDSLAKTDLLVWLEKEFGFPQPGPDAIQTVSDVLLGACGEAVGGAGVQIVPPAKKWFRVSLRCHASVCGSMAVLKTCFCGRKHGTTGEHGTTLEHGATESPRLLLPDGELITDVFLAQARRYGSCAILADQRAGVKTYRDLLTSVLVLAPILRRLPGEYLGIMLPAGVAAATTYFAALFAGKTPVMVNWTLGQRNLLHSLQTLQVQRVVTARALVARLQADGTDLGALAQTMVFLEDVGKSISWRTKIAAVVRARLGLVGSIQDTFTRTGECGTRHGTPKHTTLGGGTRTGDAGNGGTPASPVAVVLFTSGSEDLPKAVPLTHANILADIRAVAQAVCLYPSDRLLGMLPPFHSFGLTVTTVLGPCLGMRTCYWPSPVEAAALAGVIEAYQVTLAVGTPTFMGGIARAARPGQLDSLRLAVTGAEKCPPRVHESLRRACTHMKVLEGYGITECSPIVSVNDAADPVPGTIGKVLPGLEHAIVDERVARRVPSGATGMLLVRGPTIFPGYLNYTGPSPFVEFEGKPWYRTGDLVSEDANGVLTFAGRLKRFVKLGGEMISLPAIEAVLEQHYSTEPAPAGKAAASRDRQGAIRVPPVPAATSGNIPSPLLAVEAAPNVEPPELVLFTTLAVSREEVNGRLHAAGLSPLHNIRRVIQVESIPTLGTGKTDYRALKDRLK